MFTAAINLVPKFDPIPLFHYVCYKKKNLNLDLFESKQTFYGK